MAEGGAVGVEMWEGRKGEAERRGVCWILGRIVARTVKILGLEGAGSVHSGVGRFCQLWAFSACCSLFAGFRSFTFFSAISSGLRYQKSDHGLGMEIPDSALFILLCI